MKTALAFDFLSHTFLKLGKATFAGPGGVVASYRRIHPGLYSRESQSGGSSVERAREDEETPSEVIARGFL